MTRRIYNTVLYKIERGTLQSETETLETRIFRNTRKTLYKGNIHHERVVFFKVISSRVSPVLVLNSIS